jgi:diguanylate cyclase (GGDEF)-like protein
LSARAHQHAQELPEAIDTSASGAAISVPVPALVAARPRSEEAARLAPRWIAAAACVGASATGGLALGGLLARSMEWTGAPALLLGLLTAGGLGALPLIAARILGLGGGSPADPEQLRDVLGAGSEACLWTWEPLDHRSWFSERWQQAFGFAPDPADPVGSWSTRLHPVDRAGFEDKVRDVLNGASDHLEHVHRVMIRSDEYRWVKVRAAVERTEDGRVRRIGGSVLDVTERHRAEAELTHGAFHDPLTELPNRALFLDRVRHAIARARRDPTHRFAVLHLDLDRFGMVNDGLGHRQGDQILIQLSRRLLACVRPGDTVARQGGDEFTILLEPLLTQAQAEEVTDRLRVALRDPFEVDGRSFVLTASIGIALSGPQYRSAADLVRDADTAKNHAKIEGLGAQRLFDSQMHRNVLESIELEGMLREALDQKMLRVEYQPIVSAADLQVVAYEALVRWTHPLRGRMSPSEFVPLAEENGLIEQLGLYVLEESCQLLASWGPDAPAMNVNLSPRQFRSETLVHDVEAVLGRTGIAPGLLRLELTETSVMDDEERSARIIRALKDLGVGLCIDDFGTGYSSLLTLHRFPIDVLKIDREFVDGMDPRSPGIVQTIVDLGRSMHMQTVAEGVETAAQRDLLRSLGCDGLQGFLFSKAVPADVALELRRKPTWL